MKTKILSMTLTFVILSLIYSSGCNKNQAVPTEQEYVSGQVAVQTTGDITVENFETFIGSLGLEILRRNHARVYFWIEIEPDSVTKHIVELSKHYPLFTSVSESEYPFSDINLTKKYLFLAYKDGEDASDTTQGGNLIRELGLHLKRVVVMATEPEIHALLKVPVGEEIFWVDKLKTYSFIKYAELNYITHTD